MTPEDIASYEAYRRKLKRRDSLGFLFGIAGILTGGAMVYALAYWLARHAS